MVEAFGPVKRNPRRRRPSLRVAPEVTDPSNIVQTFWKHSKVGRSWRSRRRSNRSAPNGIGETKTFVPRSGSGKCFDERSGSAHPSLTGRHSGVAAAVDRLALLLTGTGQLGRLPVRLRHLRTRRGHVDQPGQLECRHPGRSCWCGNPNWAWLQPG